MISSEIEPVTFQLVAKCLNQLCYRMPQCDPVTKTNWSAFREIITVHYVNSF
jgi:hypothetical protein